MRHQKKCEIVMELLWENVRFWRSWTLPNALYISISVVFADYEKIENFMKFCAKLDPKSDPKTDVWVMRDPTFEVLGGILRSLIFDEFSIGEKSAYNRQRLRHGAAKRSFGGFWRQGRRQRRWPAEAFGVWQELAGVCRKHPERPAPRKGGGGYLKATASAADPS